MRGFNGIVVILVCITAGVLSSGCAFIKPATHLRIGGVEFIDTKDNDILIEDAEFDTVNKVFRVKKLAVTNLSSPVVTANVQQMLAFAQQQRAANEGITAALSGIGGIARELMPGVQALSGTVQGILQGSTLVTPGGTRIQLGTMPAPTTQPTTQPAGP